ncbi:MAG: Larval mesenchyme specific protein, partial [uncultured Gemmatimonadetes bacterium]
RRALRRRHPARYLEVRQVPQPHVELGVGERPRPVLHRRGHAQQRLQGVVGLHPRLPLQHPHPAPPARGALRGKPVPADRPRSVRLEFLRRLDVPSLQRGRRHLPDVRGALRRRNRGARREPGRDPRGPSAGAREGARLRRPARAAADAGVRVQELPRAQHHLLRALGPHRHRLRRVPAPCRAAPAPGRSLGVPLRRFAPRPLGPAARDGRRRDVVPLQVPAVGHRAARARHRASRGNRFRRRLPRLVARADRGLARQPAERAPDGGALPAAVL